MDRRCRISSAQDPELDDVFAQLPVEHAHSLPRGLPRVRAERDALAASSSTKRSPSRFTAAVSVQPLLLLARTVAQPLSTSSLRSIHE
jgi:hypothetical protein